MKSTLQKQSLTKREREILDWIVAFVRERGSSPSVREVGDAFGVTTSAVSKHIRSLGWKGYLRPWPVVDRPLMVTPGAGREKRRPRRRPATRRPIKREPLLPGVGLPASVSVDCDAFGLNPSRDFIVVVAGEGMAEAGIHDGDYAILRPQTTVKDGDIVAAVVDGKAMLRKFYREKDRIRLEPASSNREPTFAKSATVLGVMKAIMRGVG